MKFKTLLLLAVVGAAAIALANAKDVRRYFELRNL